MNDPLSHAAICGACIDEVSRTRQKGMEILDLKPIILDFTAAFTGKLGNLEGLRFKPMVSIVKDHKYRMTIDPLTGKSQLHEVNAEDAPREAKAYTPQEVVRKLMEESVNETPEV